MQTKRHFSMGPARLMGFVQVAILLWLASFPVMAQAALEQDFSCAVWAYGQGLPDSSVTSVAQAPDGYLWVGTYNGLARFDGVHFTTFDPENTPALMHARIRHLFVGRQGTLWINTYDGSLTTFRHGKFALEYHNTHPSEGEASLVLSNSNEVIFVTSRGDLLCKSRPAPPGKGWKELYPPGRGINTLCCCDGANQVWYRGENLRLWRLRGDRFVRVPRASCLMGQAIQSMTVGPKGRLWVATDSRIAFWNGTMFRNATPTNALPIAGISALKVVGDEHVWVVAHGCVGEALNRQWLLKPEPSRNLFGEAPGRIHIVPGHHGGMWFYNYGRGLAHVDSAGNIRHLTSADGFPGDRVHCLFADREGDWWAGLDSAGLVRVRKTQFHTVTLGKGVLAKAAKSVCEDAHSNIWIGLLGGGLVRWHDGTTTDLAVPGDTGKGSVFCVCAGCDGRLWFSGRDEDLFVREKGVVRLISPVIHGVKVILNDPWNNRIWVGTTSGLFYMDQRKPEVFHVFTGVARRSIRSLALGHRGRLWAGTGNGQIYRITRDKTRVIQPEDGRNSGAIWSLLEDRQGRLWVGTFRGGLLMYQHGEFTRFTTREGLPNNVICQILDDGKGNLWLGSHRGIFRVAKSSLEKLARGVEHYVNCVGYGRSDGLPTLECSGGYQPAACCTHNGQFWFATVKGAVWTQPSDLQPNLTPPPVVIEEVLVDGQAQRNFENISGSLEINSLAGKSQGAVSKVLVIPPGKHRIEIRYTGLSLASPERVRFRYRLQGVDDSWVRTQTHRFAEYNFLPPGRYQFQVIACNSAGVWNHAGATLRLRVLPHFYETWWFEILAVLGILGGVAGTVRHTTTRRLRVQVEQMERRQEVERERARIAKDIHDDLGASLTLIAVLGDLARRKNATERLEKMSSTARQAVKSLDEIVWAVNPRNDTLEHLVDYAAQFAMNYLREAGIRCFLDVPDQMPDQEVAANVRHNVFLVVKEALQNIVKHSRATEVWLRFHDSAKALRVVIEDNGCGFDRPPEDAWADGLGNMRQRLAEIGGKYEIRSQIGVGTTIEVELPRHPPV